MFFLHASDTLDYTCELPGGGGVRASTLAIVTVCLTAFITTVDFTIVNIALPDIGADLQIGIGSLQWVADSYNIALAGFLLLGAGLGDRFTHRRTFLAGISVFLVGTLAASFASAFATLILGRVLMGVGAALLLTPALALLGLLCAGGERARALGLWALLASLGFALGPLLGGVLLSVGSWRLVFLVTVPVLVAILLAGHRVLPANQDVTARRIDLMGALLSVVALVLLLGGLIEGPERGWTSAGVIAMFVVGLIGVVSFVWWERRTSDPMVDLSLLGNRAVLATLLAFFPTYLSSSGILFVAPQQLMIISGFGALAAGLILLPLAVVDGYFGLRAARLAQSHSPRQVVVVGMASMVAGFAVLVLSVTGAGSMVTALGVVLGTMLAAVGWGLVTPVANAQLLGAVTVQQTGSAAGLGSLARFVGAAFGVAIIGTVLAGVYSRQVLHAFSSTGVPLPEMANSPASTEAAVAMLPEQQFDLVEPLTLAAFENATQAAYLAGGIIVALCLGLYLIVQRS